MLSQIPTQIKTITLTIEPSVIFPTETIQPTQTPTSTSYPTYTIIPTEIPTLAILPISTLTQKCLTIQPDLPISFLSAGKVLFSDDTGQEQTLGSIMGMVSQDSQPHLLAGAPLSIFSWERGFISPDRKLLAYESVTFEEDKLVIVDDQLVVIDVDGQVIASMDWDDDWFRIEGWLDMEHLVLASTDYAWPGVYIVNPFTGQSQEFIPTLPDIFIDPIEQEKGSVKWKFILEPSLSLTAYERRIPGATLWDDDWSFVLWDLPNELEKWVLQDTSFARMDIPIWSPDSSHLAVIVQDRPDDNFERFELYLVERDGNAQKLIDLPGNADIGLGKMRWSPNGRYIAIGGDPFIILDTVTRQVKDYCISAGFFAAPIYWSPDSKQVLVSYASRESGSQPYLSIVIDVEHDVAAQLHPDPLMEPIGWLALP